MSERVARSARIALTAGGAALLAAALIGWALLHSGAVDAWLTRQIAARVGPHLHFSAARAVWWRPGVVLDDVALNAPSAAPPQLTAASAAVRARLRVSALLLGRIEVAALWIDGLRVTVEGGDGSAPVIGPDALSTWIRQSPLQPLPALWVRHGEITYRPDADHPLQLSGVDARFVPDGYAAYLQLAARLNQRGAVFSRAQIDDLSDLFNTSFRASIDADHIDIAALLAWLPHLPEGLSAHGAGRIVATLARASVGAPVEGNATAEVFNGGATWSSWNATSPLRWSAHGVWNEGALTLSRGRLEAAHLSSDALAADTIAAAFDYHNGALRVDRAELHACGGTWRPAGRIRFEPSAIDGSLDADGIDGEQLGAVLHRLGIDIELPHFDGPLHLIGSATGSLDGPVSGSVGLETTGGVAWSNVRIAGPSKLSADVQLASGRTPTSVVVSNGHAEAPAVAVGPLTVDAIEADFAYAGGSARATLLRGAALGSEWTYRGTLPTSDGGAWGGELAATNVSLAALRRALAGPEAAAATDGAVDLTARLTGNGFDTLGGSASLRLAGDALTWDAVRVEAPADASATLRWRDARLVVSNGSARARTVRMQDLAASDVRTGFHYADGRVGIASLTAQAFDGKWRANGGLTFAPSPSWTGIVVASGVDLDTLLHAVPGGAASGARCEAGVADLHLRLWHRAAGHLGGTADVHLTAGSLFWRELRVDAPAHANGGFDTAGGSLVITHAAADAAGAAYGRLSTSAAVAQFSYGADRLSFSNLHFQSCGGTWTHSGWFTLRDRGPFSGQLSVEGAVPSQLLAMFGQSNTNIDFARADVDGEFEGEATSDWALHLRATGAALVSNGTISAINVLRPIFEIVGGAGRRFAAVDRRTRVQQFGGIFGLREGRFITPDFSLQSDDFGITSGGSIGLDGSLDLQARILLSAQGISKMLVLGSIPLTTSSLPTLPPIPARITGTLANPVVRPIAAALPAATARWLIESVLRAPHNLAGAVVRRLGQLWDVAQRLGGAVRGALRPSP
jgi:hypothetical protein